MFLGKPLPFTLSFDPSAFNQKMQSARAGPIRDGDVQAFLASLHGAEVRHRQIQSGKIQRAFHQPGRLPQWQPEQGRQHQTGLDRGIAECG